MPVFEVFSYGVRTRVVMRSDFIEDYASYDVLLSTGPMYTVNWQAENGRLMYASKMWWLWKKSKSPHLLQRFSCHTVGAP